MGKDTNALGESFKLVSSMWRHRKSIGGIQRDIRLPGGLTVFHNFEAPAQILDTFDAIYGDKMKPLLMKSTRTDNGWRLIFHLPPGISFNEIRRKQDYLIDATNAVIGLQKVHGKLLIDVQTTQINEQYPYQWDPAPHAKMHLPIPVGYTAAGLIVADLAAMPHLLIAGHPGAGKSNFLHTIAVSLLLLSRQVNVCVIDFKRLEFAYLRSHALITTSMERAQQLLATLNYEMDRRLDKLEKARVVKIQDYTGDDMPYFVLIIDELAEMIDEDCQALLNRILRLSRAAGISVVCATQRPSSTIFNKFGDSKAMFSANCCFKVRDE
ncbi:MAG: FtsK/SpoIIIE domain-containing protein, partial [Clostridia bacterium]|nr:FtsK/SpoIIIE domain-containing protein [Clostridia bacterium]